MDWLGGERWCRGTYDGSVHHGERNERANEGPSRVRIDVRDCDARKQMDGSG